VPFIFIPPVGILGTEGNTILQNFVKFARFEKKSYPSSLNVIIFIILDVKLGVQMGGDFFEDDIL
jgi:hypothetical protein